MKHISQLMQDQSVVLARHQINFVTAPSRFEKLRAVVAYGTVIIGVGVAVFAVTPVRAAGSMAQDVRVVSVSPSIVQFGTPIEQKLRADIVRQDNKALHDLQLEDQRSINRRILEQDKAYYKKLEWQRKHK